MNHIFFNKLYNIENKLLHKLLKLSNTVTRSLEVLYRKEESRRTFCQEITRINVLGMMARKY